MTVPEMIAELRARGKTLVQIGKRIQVSQATVQRWASGEFEPRYQQGKALEHFHESVIAQVRLDNHACQAEKTANETQPSDYMK